MVDTLVPRDQDIDASFAALSKRARACYSWSPASASRWSSRRWWHSTRRCPISRAKRRPLRPSSPGWW